MATARKLPAGAAALLLAKAAHSLYERRAQGGRMRSGASGPPAVVAAAPADRVDLSGGASPEEIGALRAELVHELRRLSGLCSANASMTDRQERFNEKRRA